MATVRNFEVMSDNFNVMETLGNCGQELLQFLPASRHRFNHVKENRYKFFPEFLAVFRFSQVEVFWDVTPCSAVVGHQRLGGPCCLHLHHAMKTYWGSEIVAPRMLNFWLLGDLYPPLFCCLSTV
jgi:hypothetical protein